MNLFAFFFAMAMSSFVTWMVTIMVLDVRRSRRVNRERSTRGVGKDFEWKLSSMYSAQKILGYQYRWLRAHWQYATCDSDELIIQSLPDYNGEIIRS